MYLVQPRLAALHRLQRSFAIRHFGGRHGDGVGQPLAVYRNMTLDARDFLACIITLATRRARVLHTLRVDDQERWLGVAPQSDTGRANLIFLASAPARSHRAGQADST